MSAPGSASLGPPGPPAPRRGGGSTPALPSAPRRTFCLRSVKWLGTVPGHIPPRFRTAAARVQSDAAALPGLPVAPRTAAKNAVVIDAATLGSRVDKYNRRMKKELGDKKSLSLVEEFFLARLDSFESAYRTAHGQAPVALDDDDSNDEEGDGGDDDDDGDGDGDGDGAVAGADGS
ncbi:MAG: hypothetical protein M1816_001446 [Peltula sp. TS41687]|nr:MAG: hypothetical protein M1816_001446 [Peltula sp. TS41687]